MDRVGTDERLQRGDDVGSKGGSHRVRFVAALPGRYEDVAWPGDSAKDQRELRRGRAPLSGRAGSEAIMAKTKKVTRIVIKKAAAPARSASPRRLAR
jgi:hypothetical protein